MTHPTLENQLKQATNKAVAMTHSLIEQYPKYSPLDHAKTQLELIQTMLKDPTKIKPESITMIDIVLMAIKTIDAHEPEYADALCLVANLLESLADSNQS